jgi:hypothetical protein
MKLQSQVAPVNGNCLKVCCEVKENGCFTHGFSAGQDATAQQQVSVPAPAREDASEFLSSRGETFSQA